MTKSITDTLRLNNAVNTSRALDAWEKKKDEPITDSTENLRRAMIESGQPHEDLARADQRWDTDQLREQFEVHGFLAPFIVVTRKSDGVKGSMEFTHSPRFYFNFLADND